MEKLNEKKKSIKRNNVVQLLLILVVIILLNIISAYLFTRFDLTSEKRYSLAPATKKVVKKLDDVMFFKVYLSGDLPPAFQRLANETREMLDEFRAYSNFVQYQFVDLSAIADEKDRNFAYRSLAEKGLQPTSLRVNKKGQSSQVVIFPGAIVTYRGHETPVQLLSGSSLGEDPNVMLNNSVQSLEYNLASAIQVLTRITKPIRCPPEHKPGAGPQLHANPLEDRPDREPASVHFFQVVLFSPAYADHQSPDRSWPECHKKRIYKYHRYCGSPGNKETDLTHFFPLCPGGQCACPG
ncbi:MAG: Gldg family protein [Bacteroidetes bacterium]|nr:Gldg family protein [Bacteroidota bacterium]